MNELPDGTPGENPSGETLPSGQGAAQHRFRPGWQLVLAMVVYLVNLVFLAILAWQAGF